MTRIFFDIKKSKFLALFKKIRSNRDYRDKAVLCISTTVNYFFAGFQLYGGIRYRSAWFTALGVYYAVLTSVRLYLGLSKAKRGRNAWKVFHFSGLALVIANLALIIMISIMIAEPSITTYGYSTIITAGVVFWTFYLLVSAVVATVRKKGEHDAVTLAGSIVQFVGAAVSILMLQTAMIASYGTQVLANTEAALQQVEEAVNLPTEVNLVTNELMETFVVSNRITGIVVGLIVLVATTYMIVKGRREYRRFT